MQGAHREMNLEGGLYYSAKGSVPLRKIYSQNLTKITTQVVN